MSKNDGQLNIRIPKGSLREARRAAKKLKKPLSEIVRDLLDAWLGKMPEEGKPSA